MVERIVVNGIRIEKNFTAEKYGRMTTIGPTFWVHGTRYQVCQCECGAVIVVRRKTAGLISKSCGCFQRDNPAGITHGLWSSPEYKVWDSMRQRCSNPKSKHYGNYGGRGIKVCERWAKFENFIEDMGRRPSAKHSIDRIDNDGNYEAGNCRWVTRELQNSNRRNAVFLTVSGETRHLHEWCEIYGIEPHIVYGRVFGKRMGWDAERALNTPVKRKPSCK